MISYEKITDTQKSPEMKFPFSMENLPRQRRGFGCLSLKFGCIVTALIVIVYTCLAIGQLIFELLDTGLEANARTIVTFGAVVMMMFVHSVSLALTVIMLRGVLMEQAKLIRPWVMWKSLQLLIAVLIFVFLNTTNMIGQMHETSITLYAVAFASLLIRFYMIVLVASYYRQLTEDCEELEKLTTLINENWYTEA